MNRPKYKTGEEIMLQDEILLEGYEGIVELIVTEEDEDWDNYWHEHGEGLMIKSPYYGRIFANFDADELEFVKRAPEKFQKLQKVGQDIDSD